MLLIAGEITQRILTGRPQIWVVELSEYSLLLMTCMSATWILKKGGHVRMDWLAGKLQPRARVIVDIVTSVMAAISCLVLVWYGSTVTLETFQKGINYFKAVGFPRGPIIIFIPIGCFLMFIQFIRNIYNYVAEMKNAGVKAAEPKLPAADKF
jgi:TRAP-type C4-dicarboxylate transport system permease small subunit